MGGNKQNLIWCKKFKQIWKRSDYIFDFLRTNDDFYQKPIKLRLPLIFYLGHLPCFAWLQFRYIDGINKTINELYDKLFQRGVDPNVETGIVRHQHSSRFSIDENVENQYWRTFTVQSVLEYKQKVRSEIINVLNNGNLNFCDINILNILNVTVEHEMMHQETLMYLFAQLPLQSFRLDLINKTDFQPVNLPLAENQWIALSGGKTSLGKPYNNDEKTYSFGWDNEFPCEPIYVSTFEIQSHPIRIGDFLEFVLDNGYKTKQWWDNDVYQWIEQSNITHPMSWTYDKSYRVNFILQRNIPIESLLNHPVIVSQVEAKAYCRWLSNKVGYVVDLPTEAEWIYAMWDWSKSISIAIDNDDCNVNFLHLHTMPINSSKDKIIQWQGSAFEWTSSLFRPFTNYQGSLPTYQGYSSDFFDDQHYVLLGGSFVTDLKLIRRTFRNWYQGKYSYVFATFRCVKRNQHTDDPLNSNDRQIIHKSLSNSKHRTIPSTYLYDAHGSSIYEQLTQLSEYYLYNQELKLLKQRANDIKSVILENSNFKNNASSKSTIHFIELGCGDGSKIDNWLSPWIKSNDNISIFYHPVDISQHAIDSLVRRLKQSFGETIVEKYVKPICSTFEEMYSQLDSNLSGIKVIMLFGSTAGNFSSYDSNNVRFGEESPVMKLLSSIRSNLNVGDWFLCSFDLCKNFKTMIDAYSDSKGITSAFNYNLLVRLNRELNFNFDINNYKHYATYNPIRRQMESWLVSTKHQIVHDQHGLNIELEPYDAIQTEVSTKYTYEDIQLLMKKNSFQIIEIYQTEDYHLPYVLCMSKAI